MADATIPILGLGTSSVPQDYTVKGGQVLGLSAVRAQFDGSGAAGAFLPCVQILSAAGNVIRVGSTRPRSGPNGAVPPAGSASAIKGTAWATIGHSRCDRRLG